MAGPTARSTPIGRSGVFAAVVDRLLDAQHGLGQAFQARAFAEVVDANGR